jgi:hypothetical protein
MHMLHAGASGKPVPSHNAGAVHDASAAAAALQVQMQNFKQHDRSKPDHFVCVCPSRTQASHSVASSCRLIKCDQHVLIMYDQWKY